MKMERINILDEEECNKILNNYKAAYYYDYKKDCFIDADYDINPPSNLKYIKNKKNLFYEAREAGKKAQASEIQKIKQDKKLKCIDKIKKIREAYKKAYDDEILKPYQRLTATENKSDAYGIAKNLDVKVCPYCNINYIYVVEFTENQLISRPDFDHFFSKSKHPELQLKLLNLVPSCQVCNRTIKHTKEFDEKKNLNPYKLSFDEIKTFDIIFTPNNDSEENLKTEDDCILSVLQSKIPEDCFKIIFESRPGVSKNDRKRANGNIKDLKLYERYQNHKDIVIDLFKKQKAFYDSRLREISSLSNESYDSLYNAMFSELNCEINHTSLGKLKKDIICKYIRKKL